MIQLLVTTSTGDEAASDQTLFGGKPSTPQSEFAWPTCKTCGGNMQFLGQIRTNNTVSKFDRLLLLFMCQNDPGCCEEWDANDGGNVVISVIPDSLAHPSIPLEGETLRQSRYGAKTFSIESSNYDSAREAFTKSGENSQRDILGLLGGDPSWIQADETPHCEFCGKKMQFVAQLEQGPNWETEMNFGGGCAYVFECTCNDKSAKMLWQC